MMEATNFTGQVAVVTGGVTGIGRAIAEAMASRGASVAIVDLDGSQAAAAAGELPGPSGRHCGIQADVSRSLEVDSAIDEVVAEMGRLDILVNNAGSAQTGPLTHEFTDEAWRATVGPLQDGVFYGIRAAGRVMIHRGRGTIVNIASIRSFAPKSGLIAYCAAKAAVAMMTKVAALEWGQYGIRVNTIAPGVTLTPNIDHAASQGHLDFGLFDRVVPVSGLGRPADIADMACFLASSEARYVTGALMVVDGGLTLVPSG